MLDAEPMSALYQKNQFSPHFIETPVNNNKGTVITEEMKYMSFKMQFEQKIEK